MPHMKDRTPTSTTREIGTTQDVLDRYQLPGPHLTVVVRVPLPGSTSDEFETRWNAHEVALRHHRATEGALAQLEQAFRGLPRTGQPVLITANNDSAAWCRLTAAEDRDRDAAVAGRMPRLIPVLRELGRRDPTLAALVDRVGADVYLVSGDEIEPLETVEGDPEFVHKAALGGWSQKRFQKRAEEKWNANSGIVADRLAALADAHDVQRIVLSGDTRACDLALAHLPAKLRSGATKVRAGGRHEPQSPRRLQESVVHAIAVDLDRALTEAFDRLSEEIAQGDHGVRGLVEVVDLMTAGMVAVLFVADEIPLHDWSDVAAEEALRTGAEVVIVPPGDDRLGKGNIAAILRRSLA